MTPTPTPFREQPASTIVLQMCSTRAMTHALLCLGTWVTVLCQDMGDTSVGSGGDTCGLRLGGEL